MTFLTPKLLESKVTLYRTPHKSVIDPKLWGMNMAGRAGNESGRFKLGRSAQPRQYFGAKIAAQIEPYLQTTCSP